MLQQPRVPATGQRQAIEIHIKWREVLAQKRIMLKILSRHTGHSMRKLDAVSLTHTQAQLFIHLLSHEHFPLEILISTLHHYVCTEHLHVPFLILA